MDDISLTEHIALQPLRSADCDEAHSHRTQSIEPISSPGQPPSAASTGGLFPYDGDEEHRRLLARRLSSTIAGQDQFEAVESISPPKALIGPPRASGIIQTSSYDDQEVGSLSGASSAPSSIWRLSGWRFGAANCATSVLVVLLINICLTAWVASNKGFFDNRGTIFEGDCEKARQMDIGLHFLINVLSTILLGASNYCMQILSSPTRSEVDAAHKRGVWLDIGTPSLTNVFHINRTRALVWFLLGASSFPLHLLFNSLTFQSTSANAYMSLQVNEAFVDPSKTATSIIGGLAYFGNNISTRSSSTDEYTTSSPYEYPSSSSYEYIWWNDTEIPDDLVYSLQKAAHGGQTLKLKRLENAQCIQTYGVDFLNSYSNVLLVVANKNSSSPPQMAGAAFTTPLMQDGGACTKAGSYPWICNTDPTSACSNNCDNSLSDIVRNASQWSPFGNRVLYCLAQETVPHCRLQYSAVIIGVVMGLNVVKAVLMLYLLFIKEKPLVTLGDALASFLERPDPATQYCCLWNRNDFAAHYPAEPEPIVYRSRRRRWRSAAAGGRWCAFMISTVLALVTTIGLLVYASSHTNGNNFSDLMKIALGSTDVRTVIEWSVPTTSLLGNVIVANMAQPICSVIYFTLNALFTCMTLAREWSRFATRRRGLRVSGTPRAAQRVRYFLQLPYRYAVPLMAASGLLHWLISQSIFLVAVEVFDVHGQRATPDAPIGGLWTTPDGVFFSCGYSPLAMVCVIAVSVVLVSVFLGFSFRTLTRGMPVAGNCSAVMAAACHLSPMESGAATALAPVQWGMTGWFGDIGHCSFSAQKVEPPVEGTEYAGVGKTFKQL